MSPLILLLAASKSIENVSPAGKKGKERGRIYLIDAIPKANQGHMKTQIQLKYESQRKSAAIFKNGAVQSKGSISVEKQEHRRLKLTRTTLLFIFKI